MEAAVIGGRRPSAAATFEGRREAEEYVGVSAEREEEAPGRTEKAEACSETSQADWASRRAVVICGALSSGRMARMVKGAARTWGSGWRRPSSGSGTGSGGGGGGGGFCWAEDEEEEEEEAEMEEEAKAEGSCGGGGELTEADGARFSSSRLNSEPPPLPLGPSSLLGPLVELGLVVLYTEDDEEEEEDKVPPDDLSRWLSSKAEVKGKG